MNHLCNSALNQNLLHKFGNWCEVASPIKANLFSGSHLQLDLPVCKNMALAVNPQLLHFRLCGKCVGRGGQLASFSDMF
jgi:hypothetical protein